jgi:hypothetical protein
MELGPFLNLGGIVFAGYLTCSSDSSISVPYFTICSSLDWGKEISGKLLPKVLRPGSKVGGAGAAAGVGGAVLACKGIKCTEDLAGPEDGRFAMLGSAFTFREGTGTGGTCGGAGAGPDAGIFQGSFSCRTWIGKQPSGR